jgi:hypothetical protein
MADWTPVEGGAPGPAPPARAHFGHVLLTVTPAPPPTNSAGWADVSIACGEKAEGRRNFLLSREKVMMMRQWIN